MLGPRAWPARPPAPRAATGPTSRVSELRGEGGDAVANDPGRLVSTPGNQRKAWWGEAWRGFEDAPAARAGRRRLRAGPPAGAPQRRRRARHPRAPRRRARGSSRGRGLVGHRLLLAALVGAVVVGGAARGAVARTARDRPAARRGSPPSRCRRRSTGRWSIPALTVPALARGGDRAGGGRPRAGAGRRRAVRAASPPGRSRPSRPSPWRAPSCRGGRRGRRPRARTRSRGATRGRRSSAPTTPAPPTRLALEPLLLRGEAFTDLGQPARALGAYRRAVELQPDNPDAWRALAIFLGDGRASRPRGRRCGASTRRTPRPRSGRVLPRP